MKKFKFVRRICALLIATTMMLVTAVSASAVETSNMDESCDTMPSGYGIMPMLNDNESAYIQGIASGATRTGIAYLDSYVGLNKTINATIMPNKNGGTVSGAVHILGEFKNNCVNSKKVKI